MVGGRHVICDLKYGQKAPPRQTKPGTLGSDLQQFVLLLVLRFAF